MNQIAHSFYNNQGKNATITRIRPKFGLVPETT